MPLPQSMGGSVRDDVGAITKVHSRNGSGPVPDRLLTKFMYTGTITSPDTSPGNVVGVHSNSIYDPDAAAGARSVKFFNNFSTLYQSWRVHSSKIKVHFGSIIPAGGSPEFQDLYCFVFPMTLEQVATGTPTSLNSAMLFPNAKWKRISAATGGRTFCTVEHYMRTGALYGIEDVSDNPQYTGKFNNFDPTSPVWPTGGGSDPDIVEFYQVQVWGADPAGPIALALNIEVEYYTECFDPLGINVEYGLAVQPQGATLTDSSSPPPSQLPEKEESALKPPEGAGGGNSRFFKRFRRSLGFRTDQEVANCT